MLVLRLRTCKQSEHSCLRNMKHKNDPQHELHSGIVTVSGALHANDGVCPSQSSNKTVRGVHSNQMQETYILSEAPQFPQNAVFQRIEFLSRPFPFGLHALEFMDWER